MKLVRIAHMPALATIGFTCALMGSGCNDTGFKASATQHAQTLSPNPTAPGGGGGSSGGGGGSTSGTPKLDTFNVAPPGNSKVDMLFCVDNSGSMADDQTLLANTFSSFIDGFVNDSVDFRIGIITTDLNASGPAYWQSKLPGYVDPNRGKILSRYATDPFLTNASSGLVNKFKENVKVGTTGSGYEQCLGSILAAIDAQMLATGGGNSGFIRDDSLLSFIIVSDEDETITSGESADARILALKNRVLELRGPASRGYRFDFVINKSIAKPNPLPAPDYGTRPYPEVYYKAAEALAALTYDIKVNFAEGLLKVSEGILNQAQNEFKLSGTPLDVSKIVVKLGTQSLVANDPNGFVYHAARNTIEIQGTAAAQAPGQTLTISYGI